MAKNHGAKQQKKLAKQKAKRSEKRSELLRLTSNDPTIRLQRTDKWPVVETLVGATLWKDGIGYLVIARRDSVGQLVFASYLVDVYCLGMKNTFWHAGTTEEFKNLLENMSRTQKMIPISPACLVKIIKGAVEYADSFGFRPHADFRHSAKLLEGIDPATCTQEFTYGHKGKPFYIQGPNETPTEVAAIMQRIQATGGDFLIEIPALGKETFLEFDDEADEFDDEEEEDENEDENEDEQNRLALPEP